MGNARNLADLLGTSTKANQVISTSGAITTTGAFTSVGIDDNGDATTMTIDTSENIGIGNTSPSSQYMTRLVVGDGSGTEGITIYSGNDSSGRLEFSDATSGDGRYAGGIVYEHNNDALRFNTNGGNERMRIDSSGDVKVYAGDLYFHTAGKGIVLGATSNTDSNTLDDYEEGTYTVALTCATSGTITLKSSYNTGTYTKIGRMVTASCDARINSVSSPQGTVLISLPFAVASDGGSYLSSIVTHGVTIQTSQQGDFFIKANDGQSYANVHYNTTTNLGLQAENAGLGANDEFQFNLTYFTT